jgi:hypothetical protein
MALCGGIVLEEALDLSDRILNELFPLIYIIFLPFDAETRSTLQRTVLVLKQTAAACSKIVFIISNELPILTYLLHGAESLLRS